MKLYVATDCGAQGDIPARHFPSLEKAKAYLRDYAATGHVNVDCLTIGRSLTLQLLIDILDADGVPCLSWVDNRETVYYRCPHAPERNKG